MALVARRMTLGDHVKTVVMTPVRVFLIEILIAALLPSWVLLLIVAFCLAMSVGWGLPNAMFLLTLAGVAVTVMVAAVPLTVLDHIHSGG